MSGVCNSSGPEGWISGVGPVCRSDELCGAGLRVRSCLWTPHAISKVWHLLQPVQDLVKRGLASWAFGCCCCSNKLRCWAFHSVTVTPVLLLLPGCMAAKPGGAGGPAAQKLLPTIQPNAQVRVTPPESYSTVGGTLTQQLVSVAAAKHPCKISSTGSPSVLLGKA